MSDREPLQSFLVRFHERIPCATRDGVGTLHDDSGRTSYEILMDALFTTAPDPMRVLDVGCGDGTLLSAIHKRFPKAALAGIDLVAPDVAIARTRVPDADVRVGDCHQLPFPDKSFNFTAAHMVLMLIDDVDGAIEEIVRTLSPGGRFAFVIDDAEFASSEYSRLTQIALDAALAGAPHHSVESPDRTIHDRTTLADVFRRHGLTMVARTSYEVGGTVNVADAWEVVRRDYRLGLLEESQLASARQAFEAEVDDNELIRVAVPLSLVVAERTAP